MMQKLAVVLIILVLFIWGDEYYQSTQPPEELERFEARFYMKLPQDVEIVFSERDYGWLGDGHLFYVYWLSAVDMEAFLQQGALNGWAKLPISKKWDQELQGSIDAFFSDEAKAEMNLKSRRGYYRVYYKGKYSYSNVAIGIVDLTTNKIYFYKWDTISETLDI